MRLAFMGSPAFSVPALHALLDAGHDVVAVYCQPPRPAGRGQRTTPCPVQAAADSLGIEVRHPVRLRRDTAAHEAFAALRLDAAVVAAYGLLLPQAMLDAPARGCLNIHASLLPRHRGASPIQSAILAGDAESGVTIMRMEAGLDTGPMLLAEATPIGPDTTASQLHDRLSGIGARLIVRALAEDPVAVAQDDALATYAPKLTREDGRIDWTRDAAALDRQVRALNPWPGTFTTVPSPSREGFDTVLKACAALPAGRHPEALPGTIVDDQLTVACGQDALRLTRVQWPGRAAMDASDFLRGHKLPPGTRLGGA